MTIPLLLTHYGIGTCHYRVHCRQRMTTTWLWLVLLSVCLELSAPLNVGSTTMLLRGHAGKGCPGLNMKRSGASYKRHSYYPCKRRLAMAPGRCVIAASGGVRLLPLRMCEEGKEVVKEGEQGSGRELDPSLREGHIVAEAYARKLEDMAREPSCMTCWLPQQLCVCSPPHATPPTAAKRPGQGATIPATNVVLYTHIKEFARRSNTGAMAATVVTARGGPLNSVEVLVSAHTSHEERLDAIIRAREGRVCVAYPSPGALPAREWLSGLVGGDEVTVVFLEGTWDQARRMEKKLPTSIPRVSIALDPVQGVDQELRVNTLEALAAFLKDAWGAEGSRAVEDALRELLVRKAGALAMLHGKQSQGAERQEAGDGKGGRRKRFARAWAESTPPPG